MELLRSCKQSVTRRFALQVMQTRVHGIAFSPRRADSARRSPRHIVGGLLNPPEPSSIACMNLGAGLLELQRDVGPRCLPLA